MINLIPNHLSKKAGLAALYISGPLFLMLVNPTGLALPLLIVPFLWLFAVLFVTVLWIAQTKIGKLPRKRAVIVASIVATLPVLLLLFQSIHQLSVKDVLLSIGLIAVASFYLYRADFIR